MNKRYYILLSAVVLACGMQLFAKRARANNQQESGTYSVNVDGRMINARLGDVVPGNVIGKFNFSDEGTFHMDEIVPVEVPVSANKKIKKWGKITRVYKGRQRKRGENVYDIYDVMIDDAGQGVTLQKVEAYNIGDIKQNHDIDSD
jgi:hypothetical protein